jgi:hypothetical protein
VIVDFLEEEGAKGIVIWVFDGTELLPLGDAVTEVLELALPFA